MEEHKIYVHIGSNEFNKNLFKPVTNREHFVKPDGGLWGSPIDSKYGWNDWVKDNNFNATLGFEKYSDDKFYFKLKPSARLLFIKNKLDLLSLPQVQDELFTIGKPFIELDFEELKKEYDAIEVSISADYELYYELYGWDVDSILVMNPDCIEQVGSGL